MSQELGRDGLELPRPDPTASDAPPASGVATGGTSPTAPASPPWASPTDASSAATETAPPPPEAAPWASPTDSPAEATTAAPGRPPAVGPRPTAAESQLPYRSQPGAIPLRPLDLGDILDGTFSTIRRNPRATLGLSAVLVALQQLLVITAQVLTGDIPSPLGLATSSNELQVAGGLGAIFGLLLSAVVGAILTGMIIVVVSEDVLGHRVTIGDVWRRVRPRLWALLGAALLAGLLPFLGLFLLVVPGVILWGAWALTTPALILERLGPIKAVRRSWQLAWPDFFRVWGIRALSVLLGLLIQNLVVIPITVLGLWIANEAGVTTDEQLRVVLLVLLVLGSIVGGTIAEPFLAGVVALLYVDRRMRAEGLDIVLQLRERRPRPGTNGAVRGPADAGQSPDAQLAGWGGPVAAGRQPGAGAP